MYKRRPPIRLLPLFATPTTHYTLSTFICSLQTTTMYGRAIVPANRFAPRPARHNVNRRRSSSLSSLVETVAVAVGIKAKPSSPPPAVASTSRRRSGSSCAQPKSILKRRSVDSEVSLTESSDTEEPSSSSCDDVAEPLFERVKLVVCRHRGIVRVPILPPPPRAAAVALCHESSYYAHDDDVAGRVRFVVPDEECEEQEGVYEEEEPSWDQF
ncbi:hypothetical protein C8F01DRAFT_471019 [Mycena amicta]|nr:hypothetical protein C8F01DRAFT_471019 [Mycena amicta]